MARKYKIVLAVLFVILVMVAAVVVSGVFDINKRVEQPTGTSDNSAQTDSYKDMYTTNTEVALPLLKTTLDGVYYTMTKEGDVKFYEISGGSIDQISETGSFDVKAECSSQELPAVIHYIEKNGRTYGCGLFTNLIYPDVLLYDYGFFEVTDMFLGFNGNRLLMIDVDSSRFYSNNKVFSEIFILNGDNTTKHFLSENQRTVDFSARMKTDYKMFTNDVLDQGNRGNVLFFSSRYYVEYAESGKLDILTSGGSGENIDNVRYINDIASMNFWRTDEGTLYFAENDASGFDLKRVASSGSEPVVIKRFEGNIKSDYIVDGHYIFNRKTGDVYDVLSGNESKVNYASFRQGFNADLFYVSPNGKYCLVRGANTNNVAACGVADLENGTITAYTDDVFGFIASAVVLDDGNVIISVANGESGTSFYQLTADFGSEQ